jgi:transposase
MEFARHSKDMSRRRIREFETRMPRHAVGLCVLIAVSMVTAVAVVSMRCWFGGVTERDALLQANLHIGGVTADDYAINLKANLLYRVPEIVTRGRFPDGCRVRFTAKIGGVGLQIIRDRVLRFNARGPDGLLDGKSTGQPSKINDTQRQAVARMIESGPIPAVHGVVRWRLIDLAQWIFEEFHITIAKQTLSRELRAMGYRKLSARPRHHAQAEGAIEEKKLPRPPGGNCAQEGACLRHD